MTQTDPFFVPSLVAMDLVAGDAESVITQLARLLQQEGCVHPTYLQAVLDREQVAPTGLPTKGIGVAIPHADYHHVICPAVAVGILRQTIRFREMANPDETVAVQIVFMLALSNSQLQLDMLRQLVGLIQDEPVLRQLTEARTAEEVCALLAGRVSVTR